MPNPAASCPGCANEALEHSVACKTYSALVDLNKDPWPQNTVQNAESAFSAEKLQTFADTYGPGRMCKACTGFFTAVAIETSKFPVFNNVGVCFRCTRSGQRPTPDEREAMTWASYRQPTNVSTMPACARCSHPADHHFPPYPPPLGSEVLPGSCVAQFHSRPNCPVCDSPGYCFCEVPMADLPALTIETCWCVAYVSEIDEADIPPGPRPEDM